MQFGREGETEMFPRKINWLYHLTWSLFWNSKVWLIQFCELHSTERRRGQQRMRWLDSITALNGHEFEQTPGDSGGQGSLVCRHPWGLQRVRHNLVTEQPPPFDKAPSE